MITVADAVIEGARTKPQKCLADQLLEIIWQREQALMRCRVVVLQIAEPGRRDGCRDLIGTNRTRVELLAAYGQGPVGAVQRNIEPHGRYHLEVLVQALIQRSDDIRPENR